MLIPHSLQLLIIIVALGYAVNNCYKEARYRYKKSLRRQSERDKENKLS